MRYYLRPWAFKRGFIVACLIGAVSLWPAVNASAEDIDKDEIESLLGEAYLMDGDHRRAAEQYKKVLKNDPRNINALVGLANILSWNGRYDEAITEYNKALNVDPDSAKAKIGKADIYSYIMRFNEAIALYNEVLKKGHSIDVERKLADVLSWDKQYKESLVHYDSVLARKEDAAVRVQKARVMGWAKMYGASLDEYKKILRISPDEKIAKEMKAKEAYWNYRVKRAIALYSTLVDMDPKNTEAMFDLGQIYSYQSMWPEAKKEYSRILKIYPTHFRAEKGLEKANLISKRVLLDIGYEFFEAESPSRQNDIKRDTPFVYLSIPISDRLRLDAKQRESFRDFEDSSDLVESSSTIKMTYLNNPSGWMSAFYRFHGYSRNVKAMHNFGADIHARILDAGMVSFAFDKERLENSSVVIKERFYRYDYMGRLDLDVTKRIKVGLDNLYSDYSDHNYNIEPGFDVLLYLMLDPTRLAVKYRYFYRRFEKKVDEYFSPRAFSSNTITFSWRHFLNKCEIFYGANDIYYDVKYDLTIDSEYVVSNKVTLGFYWDINERLNINFTTSFTDSSSSVYEDRNLMTSLRYYF